jgi:hypothetical protein
MSHDSVGVRTRLARNLVAGMALLLGLAWPPAAGAAQTAGGAAPGAAAAPLQALVEAARKEGALTLVWGDSTVGSSEGMQRLAEGFNRTYGLNLAVTFTPGPAMSSMASRLLQEHQAGRPATASDAPLMKSLYMAVPKHAAHPSAAKLWINYLRGREAQDVIYDLTAMDYHRLPGSRTTADIERFQTGLSCFYEGDLDFYVRSDEAHLDNVRNEFIRMLKRS